jgi:hypothetical protein
MHAKTSIVEHKREKRILSSVYRIQQNFVKIPISAAEAKLSYTQLFAGNDVDVDISVSTTHRKPRACQLVT